MIGLRVKIEYLDHSERFKEFLPRTGTIIRQVKDEKENNNWFLVNLDDPIKYQIKIGEPFQFKLICSDNILIRSRWKGQEVGEEEPTSVFIFLVDKENPIAEDSIDLKKFYHAAWGMCSSEK